MEKAYIALLSGQLEEVQTIDSALSQTRDGKGHKRVVVDEQNGQAAKSTFMPIEQFDHASNVRILLHTGRMHQARVHAAALDRPILGDDLYGDWAVNKQMKALGVERCMLHSERYQLNHPVSGEQITLIAPVPDDFTALMHRLRSAV